MKILSRRHLKLEKIARKVPSVATVNTHNIWQGRSLATMKMKPSFNDVKMRSRYRTKFLDVW
jgi:hypothetical protein